MSIASRLSRLARRDAEPLPSDPPKIMPPSRVPTGRAVNQAQALSLSSVYRAVGLISVGVTQLPLEVHKGDKIVNAPAIIRRPDTESTQRIFIEQTIVSLAVKGNAYWLISRDEQGKVTNLTVQNPHDVTITTTSAGKATGYRIGTTDYKPEQVRQLALMRVPGSAYGLGPIQAAQEELRGHIDTRDYGSNWFEDGDVPTGVLKTEQHINAEQAKAAKESWKASQGGTRDVAVLGNGLAYTPIFLSPEDAQFVQVQQWSVTQVARLFGAPSSLMLAPVEGNTQTYQNVEQDWIGFTRFTLAKYLNEVEDALSEFVTGAGRVRFNIDALLRSDTLTRYQAHSVGIKGGFLTQNEARALENLPAIDGGDALATSTTPTVTDPKDPTNV